MMGISNGTLDRLTNTISVLQQLQRLLTISATLSDVADVLACIEVEFGTECRLEDVIQRLVSEHLTLQLARRGPRQNNQMEVAA